jgi:hypothetical protein
MPRVPTYDNFQVQQSNLPNVQVRPSGARFDAPFSAEQATLPGRQLQSFGQQLSQSGAAFARVAADEMETANQVRVNDATNKAYKARLELTFSPTDGFVNLKGENALRRPNDQSLDQEYGDKLQKQLDTISQGLGNDSQRAKFKQQADQLSLQFRSSLNQHIAKEFNDYQDSVDNGTIRTGQEQMALAWSDPNAVKQAQDAVRAAVANKGMRLGISGAALEAATVEALSPGHAAVIASAVDAGNTGYAKEYMKQVNAELSPQARLQLTKVVEAGDFEERTQLAAGDLFAKHSGNISKALAEAREKFTGKDEDGIVTRLKTLDAERVAIRERGQRDATDAAWRIYAQTGSMAKIPASVLGSMDGRDLVALRKNARADAEGIEVKTDPNIYYALTVASATDPNFKNEDLRRYFDKLSPTDRKHFADVQAKVMKGDDQNQMATVTQQKDTIVKSLGLKGQDVGIFHQVADKAMLAEQARLGRMPSQEERQKVLDRLVLEGTTPGTLWNSNTRAFKAEADGKTFTPVFNDSQKRQATAALQRQGIKNPTAQQVDAVLRATYETK